MRHLDIYIGKYIDQIHIQLPVEHIVLEECADFDRYVEPGEPNLPASTSWSFVLDNLDYNGEERYPLEWWESQARTQEEGAIQPLQIYVEARVLGHVQFKGIIKGIRYTNFQARCRVNCEDMLEFIRLSKQKMLKSFEFDTRLLSERQPGQTVQFYGGNDLPIAKSLNGEDINHTSLVFLLSEGEANNIPNDSEIARHLGWDNLNYSIYREIVRSGWVQIEDITLLTRVRFMQRNEGASGTNNIYIEVWHNADDLIEHGTGEEKVIVRPRGQYVDREGNRLERNQQDPVGIKEVTLTLHEPDVGNDTDAVVHIDDTTLNENFIFGVPFENNGDHIQITSAAYSFFDVIQATMNIINREIEDVHASGSIGTFFDVTYLTNRWRHVFWSDILMYGWSERTAAEALVGVAHQVSAYMYTTRDGKIAFHSRNMGILMKESGAPGANTLTAEEIEPTDGTNQNGGWSSYESEVPQDIIEVNNIQSEVNRTLYANENGQIFKPTLRNRSLQIENFRTHDLGIPASGTLGLQDRMRWSPGNANWPHSTRLDLFLPTPIELLHDFATSLSYPTITTKIRLGYTQLNIPIDNGQYIVDEEFVLWWIRRITVSAPELTAQCEIQKIDPVTTPPPSPDEFLLRVLAFETYLQDDLDNVTFEMGQANQAQLVFEPTEDWELDFQAGNSNLIVDDEGNLRLYYELRHTTQLINAYGLMKSEDNGQTWEKVRENANPGIVSDPDSNLIYIEPPLGSVGDAISVSVYFDENAPINEQYKLIAKWRFEPETYIWTSSDGIHFFNPIIVLPAVAGDSSPNSLFYDENENDWVIFGRTRGTDAASQPGPPKPYGGRRWPIYSSSPNWDDNTFQNVNIMAFDPADIWEYGDDADQAGFWDPVSDGCGSTWIPDNPANAKVRPDVYRGNVNFYYGIYVGVFPVFFRDDNRVPYGRNDRTTGPIYPVFGVSRSRGAFWVFPDDEYSAVDLGPYDRVNSDPCHTAPGVSEPGQLMSGFTFAVSDKKIFISTLDRVRGHYNGGFTDLPDDRKIYVQQMREDGFGALTAGQTEGSWRTTVLHLPVLIQDLYVNGNASIIRAEILSPTNNVIPGFSKSECKLASGDDTAIRIEWDNVSISSLAGQSVKVKIYFSGGSIYGIRFK